MKKFLLLFLILLIFSCKDEEIPTEHTSYYCIARKVNYMTTVVGVQTDNNNSYGQTKITVVNKDNWYLSFGTLNFNPDTLQDWSLYPKMLDTPIPEVERLIIQDYVKQQNITSTKSQAATNMESIDYRTSTVSNFNVYSLNSSLFGKPAGESLNEFFDIKGYNPAIISAPNYRLIYGRANQDSITMSINEWLSIHPLASVGMNIAPNRQISGLPLDVQFVLEMETDEGLVLRDTTQVFTITE